MQWGENTMERKCLYLELLGKLGSLILRWMLSFFFFGGFYFHCIPLIKMKEEFKAKRTYGRGKDFVVSVTMGFISHSSWVLCQLKVSINLGWLKSMEILLVQVYNWLHKVENSGDCLPSHLFPSDLLRPF